VKGIEADIEEGGKYAEIEERCRRLISTLLRGLTYYDTYDRSFLQFVIVAAYMGGAALLLEYVSSFYYPHVNALQASSGDYKPSREAQYITLAAAALIIVQGSNWHYILYVALSVYLWDQAIKGWKRCGVPTTAFVELIPTSAKGWGMLLGGAMVLEMMILGFADRAYYTLGHLIVGLVGFFALKGDCLPTGLSIFLLSIPPSADTFVYTYTDTAARARACTHTRTSTCRHQHTKTNVYTLVHTVPSSKSQTLDPKSETLDPKIESEDR